MKITLFHSFPEVQDIWREFERHADCYGFQSYKWLSNWYQSVGVRLEVKPCLILVESRVGNPILLLPLGLEQAFGVRILLWLGGVFTDYHAPLLNAGTSKIPSPHFIDLWEEIKKRLPPFDLIYFEKQPEKIGNQCNPFLILKCQPQEKSYFTALDPDWDTFYSQRAGRKTRATDRRKKRRLVLNGIKPIGVTRK